MTKEQITEGRPNQFKIFLTLTKRHLMVYFKNVPIVFFTLMVPLAILLVYALFLRPMEVGQIKDIIKQYGIILDENNSADFDTLKKIYAIADCWMMAGVLSVSCITVSLNTNYIMVKDKENDANKDMLSSPISSKTIMVSYFAFNIIITFLVIFIVYVICLLWLLGYNAYMISITDFFMIIFILLLSIVSASLMNFFIASFIKSDSVLSTVVAIFSAAIGFLIGAYLPNSMMPKSIRNVTAFFPGTYSTSLLRNYFMRRPLDKLAVDLGNMKFMQELSSMFGFEIDFFGINVQKQTMSLVILAFIGIFLILNILFTSNNMFKGLVNNVKRIKNQPKKTLTNGLLSKKEEKVDENQ